MLAMTLEMSALEATVLSLAILATVLLVRYGNRIRKISLSRKKIDIEMSKDALR